MVDYIGTDADDTYHGTDERDILRGGYGSDTLFGGMGDDTIIGDGVNHHGDYDYSPDELHGGDGDDDINGQNGDDVLYGDAGNDWLNGEGNNDIVYGGDGDDVADGWAGSDVVYGGDGNDQLSSGGEEGGTDDDPRNFSYYVFDSIHGEVGNDRLIILTRGQVSGGIGDDIVDCGSSVGTASGDDGVDTIMFQFADELSKRGSLGYVTIDISGLWSGGTGTVNGTMTLSSFETFGGARLSPGSDSFTLGAAYFGSGGVLGAAGNDTINGGSGADQLYGNDGADVLVGGKGDDRLFGDYAYHDYTATGVDTIHGDDGADYITGDGGDDVLWGDAGDDEVAGSAGADQIDGGDGADFLHGDEDNDAVSGGKGDDRIDGGTGDDRMRGGTGDDTYEVESAGDRVIESAGAGNDFVSSTIDYRLPDNVERLTLNGAAISGIGNALDNRIQGNTTANVLMGLEGADTLVDGSGNDRLDGGDGADMLFGGEDNDRLEGGTGADRMQGDGGDDVYVVDDAGDIVVETYDAGYDTVIASVDYGLSYYVEALVLGKGGLSGTGNPFANAITGGTGDDTIDGAAGTDTIDGGRGRDVLTGGLDADTFVFAAAADTAAKRAKADLVADFRHDEHDLIDVSRIDADRTQDGVQHFAFVGTAAFTHTAGELRFDAGKSGTLVSGDTDGDGKADFSIALTSKLALLAEDFVLVPPPAALPVHEVRVHAGWQSVGHDWPAPLEQLA